MAARNSADRGLVPGSKRGTPGSDRLVQCFQAVATFSVRSREVRLARAVGSDRAHRAVCADASPAVPHMSTGEDVSDRPTACPDLHVRQHGLVESEDLVLEPGLRVTTAVVWPI